MTHPAPPATPAPDIARDLDTTHLVEAAFTSDGALSLVWDDSKGNHAFLSVGQGFTHFYYEHADGEVWEGVGPAHLPEMQQHLARGLAFITPDNGATP